MQHFCLTDTTETVRWAADAPGPDRPFYALNRLECFAYGGRDLPTLYFQSRDAAMTVGTAWASSADWTRHFALLRYAAGLHPSYEWWAREQPRGRVSQLEARPAEPREEA
jgi:hypothetical protein